MPTEPLLPSGPLLLHNKRMTSFRLLFCRSSAFRSYLHEILGFHVGEEVAFGILSYDIVKSDRQLRTWLVP
jgi:hypothetical protein